MGQDATGVVFHAVDSETGSEVALRRFFPFGPNGGGLNEAGQATFAKDLRALSEVRHPALRPITCGGCDPDDHMPFVATEWIDGTSLAKAVEQTPFSPQVAVDLLDKALEISEKISQTLGHEAVWVETGLNAIIAGREPDQGFTFWISPTKWVAATDESRKGLSPLVRLTEGIMHWEGKAVTDTSGGGLGSWFRWLRSSSQTATLRQARQRLAACLAAPSSTAASASARPTPTTKAPTATAKAQTPTAKPAPSTAKATAAVKTTPAPPAKPKSKLPIIAAISAVSLLAAGLGGWAMMRKNPSLFGKIAPAESEEVLSTASIIEDLERIKQSTPSAPETEATATPGKATSPTKPAAVAAPEKIFMPGEREELLRLGGKHVKLEGVPAAIEHSTTKKTRYLTFSSPDNNGDTRIGITVKDAPSNLSESALTPLLGKKVRVTGRVRPDPAGKSQKRPVIMIESRSAIEVIE